MKILMHPEYDIWTKSPIMDKWRMTEAARLCYKSERKNPEDDSRLLKDCFRRGHGSVLEHSSLTVKFICDRAVANELVRHRLAGYSQESTRYCNYSKDKFDGQITVIKPAMIRENSMEYYIWEKHCKMAEKSYFDLLDLGATPETARAVLPLSLKTEIVVTANLREWYHILDLRTAKDTHPDMRLTMHGLLLDLGDEFPEIFRELALTRNAEIVDFFSKERN